MIAGFCSQEMPWQLYPIHIPLSLKDISVNLPSEFFCPCNVASIFAEP